MKLRHRRNQLSPKLLGVTAQRYFALRVPECPLAPSSTAVTCFLPSRGSRLELATMEGLRHGKGAVSK
jgi:hypothetical protein